MQIWCLLFVYMCIHIFIVYSRCGQCDIGGNPVLFTSQMLIEKHHSEYNQVRPHGAKNYRPPTPEAILSVVVT